MKQQAVAYICMFCRQDRIDYFNTLENSSEYEIYNFACKLYEKHKVHINEFNDVDYEYLAYLCREQEMIYGIEANIV